MIRLNEFAAMNSAAIVSQRYSKQVAEAFRMADLYKQQVAAVQRMTVLNDHVAEKVAMATGLRGIELPAVASMARLADQISPKVAALTGLAPLTEQHRKAIALSTGMHGLSDHVGKQLAALAPFKALSEAAAAQLAAAMPSATAMQAMQDEWQRIFATLAWVAAEAAEEPAGFDDVALPARPLSRQDALVLYSLAWALWLVSLCYAVNVATSTDKLEPPIVIAAVWAVFGEVLLKFYDHLPRD